MHLAEAGGPSQHVQPWLAALTRCGSLEVVVPGVGRVADRYAPFATTTVLDYEPLLFPRNPLKLIRVVMRLARELAMFYRHFRLRRPDVVVVVTSVLPSALLAARLARVKTVVYVGEIYDKGFVRNRPRAVASRLMKVLIERVPDAVVCCSRTVAAQFDGRNGSRVTTIYPGVDPGRFDGDRNRLRVYYGLEQADPCLAVVGNITRGRGQDILIRALPDLRAALPAVHCLLVGTPLARPVDLAYLRELERLAESLGVRDAVTFTGFVDQVDDVYAAADIVVNPARVNEALGRVALEALASGRPVVATRVGAVTEALRPDEDALIIEPDDPDALAAAVLRLWQDEALRERMVASGRARVLKHFSEAQGVRSFGAVLDGVVARSRGGA